MNGEITLKGDLRSLIEGEIDRDPQLRSEHTKRVYKADLDRFETWRAGRPMTKLLVEQYVAELQKQDKAPSTINRALAALRWWARRIADMAFEGPLTKEEREEIVLQATRVASVKEVRGERQPSGRSVSDGELAALIAVCEKDRSPTGIRDRALIALAWAAALRQAEITGLDIEDLEEGESDGQPYFDMLINGKGEKERRGYLNNGAAVAIREWIEIRGDDPGPVFCRIIKGGRVVQGNKLGHESMRKILEKRRQQAGLASLTWRDFRRSFAGDMLNDGVDLVTVQGLMGHSSPVTTAQYDRRSDETRRQAARKRFVPIELMQLQQAD